MENSDTTSFCLNCKVALPLDKGFAVWCHECGWNVNPDKPDADSSRLGKIFERFGVVQGARLLTELLAQKEDGLRPRWTISVISAFVISLFILVSGTLMGLLGLYLLIIYWPSVWAIVAGGLLITMAFVLRPRLPKRPKRLLSKSEAPQLFRLIDRVGQSLGSPTVNDVELTHDFNAWVTQTGIGRRPCLGIGLPLWFSLSKQEQVALIGHELGHLCNHDPVRSIVAGNAINNLSIWSYLFRVDDYRSMDFWALLAGIPFSILAKFFDVMELGLRFLTFRESQRAEFLADELGCRVSGSEAFIGLLQKIGFGQYLQRVCEQTYAAGDAQGQSTITRFAEFVGKLPAREIARLNRVSELELSRADATHPPTEHRLRLIRERKKEPEISLNDTQYQAIISEMQPLLAAKSMKLMDQFMPE